MACGSTQSEKNLELAALVVDAVVANNRSDQAKACVCSVDTHHVDAIEQELEGVAKHEGVIGGRISHADLDYRILFGGLRVALGSLF